MQDFLSIRDFNPEEIKNLLALAMRMKLRPEEYTEALKGKTLALIFEKPSLRTKVSFSVALHQLGASEVVLTSDEIGIGNFLARVR